MASTPMLSKAAQSAVRPDPVPAFDVKPWLADYASLKKHLEQQYSHLAWFASPQGGVNLPQLDRRTQRILQQAENEDDAKAALFAFVNAFHDGHLRQKPSIAPARADASNPPKAAIDKMDAASACAAIGVGPTSAIPFSLPIEGLANFTLTADGMAQVFRAGVLHTEAGMRIGVIRIPTFVTAEYTALCHSTWATLKTAATPLDARMLEEAMEGAWLGALAGQLKQMQAQGVSAVVVDVGSNGGGGDTGDSAARLFTSRPVKSARLLMAATPANAAYFDEQLDGLRNVLARPLDGHAELQAALRQGVSDFENRKAGIAGRVCDMSWVWRERRPFSPAACSRLIDGGFASGAVDFLPAAAPGHAGAAAALYWPAVADAYRGTWSGPVYVLTNGKVASAAEMFAATMRDNGIARIIGAPTMGLGCGNMQKPRLMLLAHSQLRFQAPDCVRLRADGSDEVAGIAPDLPLLPTEGESGRARAVRLFHMVEADLKADLKAGNAGTALTGAATQ
ncbi:S41 family peptidase [Massilia sp. DJPM01]|uniref:S41 family peptidase n=1 Tax=Massilia sp. DJPM01 TaxID=3024404 RepID=UPI00259F7EF8|nr:S41 family peptidase [Massilia sp. DJPM01]